MDAVQAKKPDRVPTLVDFGYYAAKYGGITVQDAFYDNVKWAAAYKKTVLDFQPDVFHGLLFFPGAAYEAVGTKTMKWPGHGVSADQSMQAVETELMKADEYDDLLEDPSDFIIRKILPRGATNLAPLLALPPLTMFGGFVSGFVPPGVATPAVVSACEAIYKAGKANVEWFFGARMAFIKGMEDLGYPGIYQAGMGGNSFEMIANNLRGMKGSMLDMYRQPDKLLEAIKRLSKISLRTAALFRPMGANNLCWMAALRGADGFMSKDQFEKFYWPFLKQSLITMVNNGYTPSML